MGLAQICHLSLDQQTHVLGGQRNLQPPCMGSLGGWDRKTLTRVRQYISALTFTSACCSLSYYLSCFKAWTSHFGFLLPVTPEVARASQDGHGEPNLPPPTLKRLVFFLFTLHLFHIYEQKYHHRFQLAMKGMVSVTLLLFFATKITVWGPFFSAIKKSQTLE